MVDKYIESFNDISYYNRGDFDLKITRRLGVLILVVTLICAAVFSNWGEGLKKLKYVKKILDTPDILYPVDNETTDEADITDMSIPIMEMLDQTGYCHLKEGIYYVRNGIDMPEGATLEGCGNKTIIRLLDDVEEGYCIRISKFNTISNIRFCGGSDEPDISSAEIGGRNGLEFVANEDDKEEPLNDVSTSILTKCWFDNFDGSAIYGHNTGGGVQESLIVSDCVIHHCDAGINLDYFTEYHKFSNVIVHHCHYACINNGENNVFVACTFHGTIGFLINNTNDDKYNSGHGSAIGCTFNHIDNWNHPETRGGGTAIGIYNTPFSFCFEGCQLWYGSVVIEDSKGIHFDGCTFGGYHPQIHVSESSTAFFSDCVFHLPPVLETGSKTLFSECHLDADGEEIQGN